MPAQRNQVLISQSELDRIKHFDRDKLVKYLIQIYGDGIKQAIIEGFEFKVEPSITPEVQKVQAELTEVLTNTVRDYDAIRASIILNYGTTKNVVASVIFNDDSAPIGLRRVTDKDIDAIETIRACWKQNNQQDPDLLPILLQHKDTQATFAAGIGCDRYYIFNIGGDFSVVAEVKVEE